MASLIPCSTGLMYSRGIAPPVILFSKTNPAGSRLDLDLNVPELTATTCLLLVDFFSICRLSDRFAIRYLRLADIRLYAELSLHTIDNNFEMEFTHAGNNRLACFLIR